MRRIGLICAASVVISGAAFAQDWDYFQKPEEHFAINFPGTPKIEDTAYKTAEGAELPARVYSAQKDTGRYVLTIADYASRPREIPVALAHAAYVLRQKGRVTFEQPVEWDGVPGFQLTIVQTDGRPLHATMLFYMNKLYIAEGSAAPNAPPPTAFHQSLVMIYNDGRAVNLEREEEQINAANELARQRPPVPGQ